jgi:hypothetical protein
MVFLRRTEGQTRAVPIIVWEGYLTGPRFTRQDEPFRLRIPVRRFRRQRLGLNGRVLQDPIEPLAILLVQVRQQNFLAREKAALAVSHSPPLEKGDGSDKSAEGRQGAGCFVQFDHGFSEKRAYNCRHRSIPSFLNDAPCF